MNSKILIAGIIAVMMCATFAVAPTDADDTGFDIVDETGTSYHFDGAAEHIVSVGYATTLTIVEAGGADKLVAVDKYSTYEQSGNELLKAVDAIDLGSFYGTSNHQHVIVTLVNLVETGEMSLDDPIILTSYPDNEVLAAELREAGFEKVLMWTTIDDYSQLIDMVESVSIIAAGEIPESVTVMKDTYNRVVSGTADIPEESRTKALYVWYYGGECTVGNTGIMGSMLQAANANNIGYDPTKDMRYGDANLIISLLEDNMDTVVFVSSSYFSGGNTLDDFYDDLFGGDRSIRAIEMGKEWNNWCPDSADGLMSMAQCLYPDIFGEYQTEPAEDTSDDGSDNTLIYAAIGIVIVIVVIAAVFLYMRRKP